MRKKAFTLAELLIALAIVGIIAALTLPSLTKMKQEAGAGPQLSKVKASVEDAAGRIFMEDPSVKLSDYTNFAGKISEYLVMTETKEAGKYRLKDGVVISFAVPSGSVSNASGAPFKDVLVDLNGSNMPNADGVDKFKFTLSSQGLMVPQGCAAKLASNNWKASKDYDSATCSAYTLGETIPDTIGGEIPNTPTGGTITCPDGTEIPANMTCNCTNTCTGELETLDPVTCECKTTKQKCWDGSIIELSAKCTCDPAEQTACTNQAGKLWNNTTCQCYDDPNYCPVKTCTELQSFDEGKCDCVTDKKKCDDGSVVGINEACPKVEEECLPPRVMINGKCDYKPICNRFTEYYDEATNTCIAYTCCKNYSQKLCTPCYKTCPNGSQIDIRDGECPVTCERKACNELQEWDEENCTCHTNKIRCEDGSIIAFGERCPQKCSDGSYVPWGESCPVVCKKKTCTELQTWDESSCSCKTTKKKCEDGSIVALNATCPKVCKVQTCNDVEVWDAKACKCFVVKKKCDDGSTVGINESCPRYCCDCDRPGGFGHRCLEGNSTTPYCGNACSNSGPKKTTSPDYGGHWEESNDLDMSERGNRTELAPLPSYNR